MRPFLIIALLVLTITSCKSKQNNHSEQENSNSTDRTSSQYSSDKEEQENEDNYPDDTYCAEVEYYNPNTGRRSSYTLTIEVESNEITQINFPNGGWMDTDHFSGAELDEGGNANFTSDKGYEYEIRIIGSSRNCFTNNVPRAVQCRGTTEDGEQCEHMTDNTNGLCWQHQDQK